MPMLAALDVGSNALRLAIGEVDEARKLTVQESLREPVRLGQDTFTHGTISEGTIEAAVAAFQRFREAIDRRGAVKTRAVATSALREAGNAELFVDRIAGTSGIEIEIIGPEEEARLIHLSVADRVNLKNKLALLVDIGGGSSEITFASDTTILSTESLRIGAVRLLQMLEEKKHGPVRFTVLLSEYMEAVRKRIIRDLGARSFDICVGTGGNIEAFGDLVKPVLGRDRDGMLRAGDLDDLLKRLQAMTYEERVQDLGLRPDRADVIVPAGLVLRTIMRAARAEEMLIPKVGLKEGLLLDMADELYGNRRTARRDQVVAAALQLGRKYGFDEQHGLSVARYATQIFDQTKALHNLGIDHRLLLEVAAMVHDIGGFVNASEHHKHTFYIVTNSPLVGLSRGQTCMIANIARYHRKSAPKIQHDGYRVLSPKERVVVSKLAAILRLADGLDNEHAARVSVIAVDYRKPRLLLRLKGEGDLMLEKWATMKRSGMFEDVFNVKVSIED